MELLEDYRVEIDKIDREITQLLEKRMNVAKAISKYKMENNMQIFHPDREKMVIEKNKGYLENKEYEELVESFYDNLMYLSRLVQQKEIYPENKIYTKPYKNDRENLVVGYQGVAGSFGNEAMLKYFKNIKEAKSYEKFEEVFKAVESGEIEYGILPVENSSTGGIGTVEDLLKEYNLYIVGEECIKISQNLVGIKGATVDDIKEVYSHPQGFEQSKKFLRNHEDFKLIYFYNTAISAKHVSKLNDKGKAAIASSRAAKIYNLDILAKNIHDNNNKHTKFVIISKNLESSKESNKITVSFSLENRAGSLYNLLGHFVKNNLNMIKIESRPSNGELWEYVLYVDLEGNINDEKVKNAINLIKEETRYFKLLGCYKKKEGYK